MEVLMKARLPYLLPVALLHYSVAWSASSEIKVDEISRMDAQVLQLTATTPVASLPSGDPVTTSVSAELTEKVINEKGKLESGMVRISVRAHWNESDSLFDYWAHVRCIEIDTQAAIARALEKADIKDFARLGISLSAPTLNNLGPTQAKCEIYDHVDPD
jgi:hypothetical protein